MENWKNDSVSAHILPLPKPFHKFWNRSSFTCYLLPILYLPPLSHEPLPKVHSSWSVELNFNGHKPSDHTHASIPHNQQHMHQITSRLKSKSSCNYSQQLLFELNSDLHTLCMSMYTICTDTPTHHTHIIVQHRR